MAGRCSAPVLRGPSSAGSHCSAVSVGGLAPVGPRSHHAELVIKTDLWSLKGSGGRAPQRDCWTQAKPQGHRLFL